MSPEPPFDVADLRHPGLYLDPRVKRMGDDRWAVRFTDSLLAQVVSYEATTDDLIEWGRLGAPPENLTEHREDIDTAIARTRAEQDQVDRGLTDIQRRHFGEPPDAI